MLERVMNRPVQGAQALFLGLYGRSGRQVL